MHANQTLRLLHYDVKNMKHLFTSTGIRLFGAGMLGTFVGLLIFQQYSPEVIGFQMMLLFFFLQSVFAFLLNIFVSSYFIHKRGTKISMFLGIVFLVLYQNFLFLIQPSIRIILLLAFCIATFISFFRTSFHLNMATVKHTKKMGSQIAILNIIVTIVLALSPLIGGYLIENIGVQKTAWIANCFVIMSVIPLLLSAQHHQDCFAPKEKNIISHIIPFLKKNLLENKSKTFSAKGYIEFAGTTLRPLMIYVSYRSFSKVGLIVALTTVVSVILLHLTGRFLNKHAEHKVMKFTIGIQLITWIVGLASVLTGYLQGFVLNIVETLSKFTKSVGKTCIEKKLYDYGENQHQNFLEVLLHELAIHGSRAIICGVGVVVSFFCPFYLVLGGMLLLLLLIIPFQYKIFGSTTRYWKGFGRGKKITLSQKTHSHHTHKTV